MHSSFRHDPQNEYLAGIKRSTAAIAISMCRCEGPAQNVYGKTYQVQTTAFLPGISKKLHGKGKRLYKTMDKVVQHTEVCFGLPQLP